METVTIKSLIEVPEEVIELERKDLNISEKDIQENIDAIIEWIKKQDHLVEALPYMNRNVLEHCLIMSKGSLEFCKGTIDRLLTSRGLLAEIALNRTFEEFEGVLEYTVCCPLPHLNLPERSRIFCMGLTRENSDFDDFLAFIRFAFVMAEYRLNYDYICADRYLVDLKYLKASLVTKLNPIILSKAETLVTKIYGVKLKGIHIVNAPPFVDKIVYILKQVFREKLAKRIYVHKSEEELFEYISKDIVPVDFGGNGPSCINMMASWRNYFKTDEAKRVLDDANKMYSNDSRRSTMKFNEEYLGMPGSFKQLSVD